MAENNNSANKTARNGGDQTFRNPIVFLAFAMLAAIVLLIGATTLGLDKGLLLSNMGKVTFARGLITYLFAVVTIGTAVVLVVSALTSEETEAHEKRFQRGKEILLCCWAFLGPSSAFTLDQRWRPKAGNPKRRS